MNFITCAMKNAAKRDPEKSKRYIKMFGGGLAPGNQYLDMFVPKARPLLKKVQDSYFGQEAPWSNNHLDTMIDILKSHKGSDVRDITEVLEGRKTPSVADSSTKIKIINNMKGILKELGYEPTGNKLSDMLNPLRLDDTGDTTHRFEHLFDKNGELKHEKFPVIYKRFLEAVARDKFRLPIYKEIKSFLKKDAGDLHPMDKSILKGYSEDYSGYRPGSDNWLEATKRLDKVVSNYTARSQLGLSVRLQVLHAARYVASGIPEVGPLNSFNGLVNTLKSPTRAYKSAVQAGLVEPFSHKMTYGTLGEKADHFLQFMDAANTAVKVLTHEGMKAKYKGDPTKAAAETARSEMMATPVSPQPRVMTAIPTQTLLTQYKGFTLRATTNIVQHAIKAAKGDKNSMRVLVSYIAAGYGLRKAGKALGLDFNHFNPFRALDVETQTDRTLKSILEWGQHLDEEDKNGHTGAEKISTELGRTIVPTGRDLVKKDEYGNMHVMYPGEEVVKEMEGSQ